MDFIISNLEVFVGMVVFLIMLLFGVITNQWSIVKINAYQLMLSAQRLMATEEGRKRFDDVYSKLWIKLPVWVRKIVGPAKLKKQLQHWYDLAKDMLRDES